MMCGKHFIFSSLICQLIKQGEKNSRLFMALKLGKVHGGVYSMDLDQCRK